MKFSGFPTILFSLPSLMNTIHDMYIPEGEEEEEEEDDMTHWYCIMHKPRNGTQGGLMFLSLSLYLLKLFSLDEITFISSKIINFLAGTAPCKGDVNGSSPSPSRPLPLSVGQYQTPLFPYKV